MKYFLSIFAFVLLMSCTSQKTNPYSEIQYEAGACFGSCPMFKLTINPDRTAIIEAEHFTFEERDFTKDDFSSEREGTFKATIKKEDYDTLISMLNEINVKSLNPKYGSRNITDLPTSYLRVKFSDKTSKIIEDYGKKGTENLAELWEFFEDLRFNQTWTKVQ